MSRTPTILGLELACLAVLLFGRGKLPRAWGALWGPAAPPHTGMAADAASIGHAALGFFAASVVLVILANTPAYPLALGTLILALLYLMLERGGIAAAEALIKTFSFAPAAPASGGKP